MSDYFRRIRDFIIDLYNKLVCSITNQPDCYDNKINNTHKPISFKKKDKKEDITVVNVKIKKVVVKKHKNEN